MNDFDPESFQSIEVTCPGFQARATARALTRFYNACFKPFGLTSEQFSLLVGIATNEGATLVDLANRAGVDSTTLSRNVQSLERRDLVNATGGRGAGGKRLALTKAGRQLAVDALPAWNWARAELARQVGEKKLETARRLMAELTKAADSALP